MDKVSAFFGAFWRKVPSKLRSMLCFRSTATVFEGRIRGTDERASMIYIGNGANLAFIASRVFDKFAEVQHLGSCNIWNAAGIAREHAAQTDLSAIDLPWPFGVNYASDSRVIELPAWVHQELQIGRDWKKLWSRMHRSVRGEQMRKIRKYDLTCAATTARGAIDRFYDTMYVPHTRRRYGPNAYVESRAVVRKAAVAGTLLEILRQGELVAACVLRPDRRVMRMAFAGFAVRDLRDIDGASAAMYYYSLVYTYERKFRSLDFCGSRPVLDDGVLRVKRGWGAEIRDDWALETLLIQFNNQGPGVTSILAGNPVIVRQENLLLGKVLLDGHPPGEEALNRVVHELTNPGLDCLCIYSLHGFEGVSEYGAEDHGVPVRLIDLSACEDSVAAFCDDQVA